VASFALSLHLTATNIPWAFYSLPARAWELGLGALLALAELRRHTVPTVAAPLVGWSGVALIAGAVALLSGHTPYPGTAALLPTLGAALLIAGGAHPSRATPGWMLSTAVPRFFGRISYSLYLWSWPLLALAGGAAETPLPLSRRLALAALAIPLAAITQQLVEQPLRRGRWIGTAPRRTLALAGALTLALVAVSLATYERAWLRLGVFDAGTAQVEPPATLVALTSGPLPADVRPSLAAIPADAARVYADKCHLGAMEIEHAECAYGVVDSPRAVMLFGDSHAASWFPALERIATRRKWRLLARTKSACNPADVPVWNFNLRRAYPECTSWRESVLREIERTPPALVVLSGSRTLVVVGDGAVIDGAPRERAWMAGLERTIRRIEAAGSRVIVIADTPRPAADVPTCLSAHVDDVAACTTPRANAVDDHWRGQERAIAAGAGAGVIDPTEWVCPTDPCPAVVSSCIVFRDNHHLSTPFVELLASRVEEAMTH
jgi:hypothetical protein